MAAWIAAPAGGDEIVGVDNAVSTVAAAIVAGEIAAVHEVETTAVAIVAAFAAGDEAAAEEFAATVAPGIAVAPAPVAELMDLVFVVEIRHYNESAIAADKVADVERLTE